MADDKTRIIRDLNDRCRKLIQTPQLGMVIPCKIYLTSGISELDKTDQLTILKTVRDYDEFTEDNDPYGEHDFGSFDFKGQKIFWKIDYYAYDLERGSEDPSDIHQTIRVLTILFAFEY